MNLYIGDFWVPFPSSEYGGSWVVIAKDRKECEKLLKELSYYEEFDDLIAGAVGSAEEFKLAKDETPRVVDTFFT